MRRTTLLVLLAITMAAGCGGDQQVESGAQATTSSVVTTVPASAPFPFPSLPPLPTPLPPLPPDAGGDVLNIHSRVFPLTPGQTSWSASGTLSITVRTDKAAPKAGEAVAFEVVAASVTQACCRVVLRPGGDAVFDAGGGLGCLPGEAAGTRTATFRWVHVYPSSGQFTLSVMARAGTCSEPAGTGGLTGVIPVS